MVDVIKRGVLPEETVHEVTCSHCYSELRFKEKEAKLIDDQRDGRYLQITCPVCDRTITKSATRHRNCVGGNYPGH